MTMPRGVLAINLVFVVAFDPGCGVVSPGRVCTAIGCPGLVVQVTGATAQTPLTVILSAPDGSTRSATCPSVGGTCPLFLFADFTPATVTIRVLTGTQTIFEETTQPMYKVTPEPNGPGCPPPECRTAQVTVPF